MARNRSRLLSALASRRLFAGLWAAGLPWLSGCSERPLAPAPVAPAPQVRGADPETPPVVTAQIQVITPAPVAVVAEPKPVPVSLDAVLRLADGQNTQIALAREKLNQAGMEQDLAENCWVPQIDVVTGYGRHEGGTQNPDGTFVHSSYGNLFAGMEINGKYDIRELTYQRINAERKVWQQRGELSRITNENLLDAATTYVDLLTARTGEAVAKEWRTDLESLRKWAADVAQTEPGARVQVVAVDAALQGHKASVIKVHQQGDAASAKLAYLLGVDPTTQMVPVDRDLMPVELVNAALPTGDLVNQALAGGPGVRELQGLLTTIQRGLDEAKSKKMYMPVVEVHMLEGAWGAGPGEETTWDNRWDLGLQLRFNLSELLTAKQRLQIAQSGYQQANLSYQDLRAKLTLGVEEAQDEIRSGREQILAAEEQVKRAREVYRLSNQRMREHIQGSSAGEVLQALVGVQQAQMAKLQAINAYNKAEIRLLLLTSASSENGCGR